MMLPVRPGDLISCASTGGILSTGIRCATDSGYSHTQLVVEGSSNPITDALDIWVLEVGLKIRICRFRDLNRGQFRIDRPTAPLGEHPGAWGELVARDVCHLVRHLQDTGQDGYPWWKLPAYLLPGTDWKGRLIRSGPRQVCSVMSIRPLVSHGWQFYIWDPKLDDRRRVDTHDEIEAVRPSDVIRWFVEGGAREVYRTKFSPVI